MKKILIDDLENFSFLGGLSYSPDKQNAAYIVTKPNMKENSYERDIHLIRHITNGKTIVQLTSGGNAGLYTWEDEQTILFASARGKEEPNPLDPKTTFYRININGGEAVKAFDVPRSVVSIKALPAEDTFLVATIQDPFFETLKDMDEDEKKEQLDYEVVDEIPFWSNGSGFTNKKRVTLSIFNQNDAELVDITDQLTYAGLTALNKDKTKALIITNRFESKMEISSRLQEVDLKTLEITDISPFEEYQYRYAVYVGDKIVFHGTDGKAHGLNQNSDIFVLENGEARLIASPDTGLVNCVGNDVSLGSYEFYKSDDENFYFIATNGFNSEIMKLDLEGNMQRLFESKGAINTFDIGDGEFAFIGLQDMQLQEVYRYKQTVSQITKHNEEYTDTHSVRPLKRIDYERNGYTMSGWVIEPVGYEKGKKYPAILDIHGGPKTVYGEVYFHEMQVWANEGYFVFFMNPRGSDGYGNDFMDIRGKYGTVDYDDLMDFTDRVLEAYPDIDEKNLGVTGGSYGGYMTNWIIGHTDRFKAAASQRSIANWLSKFGTTDIGYYFVDDQNANTPWTDAEALWWHSPMKYADKAKTPTLFIHSVEDYRCWLPEGIQMFTSLKYHGVDARLVMFKGENHELSRSGKPKHRVRRLREMSDWFAKYLK